MDMQKYASIVAFTVKEPQKWPCSRHSHAQNTLHTPAILSCNDTCTKPLSNYLLFIVFAENTLFMVKFDHTQKKSACRYPLFIQNCLRPSWLFFCSRFSLTDKQKRLMPATIIHTRLLTMVIHSMFSACPTHRRKFRCSGKTNTTRSWPALAAWGLLLKVKGIICFLQLMPGCIWKTIHRWDYILKTAGNTRK